MNMVDSVILAVITFDVNGFCPRTHISRRQIKIGDAKPLVMNSFYAGGQRVVTSGGGIHRDVRTPPARTYRFHQPHQLPQLPVQVPQVQVPQVQLPQVQLLTDELSELDIIIDESPIDRDYTPILCGETLNLHFFDDKLVHASEWIRPDVERVSQLDPIAKTDAIAKLKEMLIEFPFQIPGALEVFDIVSNEHDSSNRDPITNLSTPDLLFILYERIVNEQYEDCLDILITQLSDMRTGMCPQGRVTRLLQIIVMFDNFI